MDEMNEFRMSPEELKLVAEVVSRDPALAGTLPLQNTSLGDAMVIRLSHADVERLRDSLTIKLAAEGFDEHYMLNDNGKVLEELIDRFEVA